MMIKQKMFMEAFRQTGRSTRMLEAAATCAQAGNYVFVVCVTPAHIKFMKSRLRDIRPDADCIGSEKVRLGNGSISFMCANAREGWSWHGWRFQGSDPSCVTFVDHLTIEGKYRRILEELHRWDADPAGENPHIEEDA